MVELDSREIFTLLVYTLALGLISAAIPLVSQILVNQAAFTGAAAPIIALAVIVFGVAIIAAVIRLFQIQVTALIAKRIFVCSAVQGTQALLDSPSRSYEFDDREVANRFFDVTTFQAAFAILASEGLGVLVVSGVGVAILAIYHPLFIGFSLLVIVACLAVISLFAKHSILRNYKRSLEKYRTAYWLSQVAENRSLLRQTRHNKIIQARTDELSTSFVKSYFDYLRLLLWQSGLLLFIQSAATAAFFGVGGWLVINGQLNLGQLVAAEIIVVANMSTLTRFYFYLDSFYEAVVAAGKIEELTDVKSTVSALPHRARDAKVAGLTVTCDLLTEPLELRRGDVVALRGPSRRNCSVLLRDIAASDHIDHVSLQWDSDKHISRENSPHYLLYIARPAVLRMSLAENLSLLSDANTMGAARDTVLDNPLLRPSETVTADQMLNDVEISISDRARYAVARVLMSSRPVVLVDMFFNLLEVKDQITFVREFERRFPDRILLLNSFDTAIDPFITRVVNIKGTEA